MFAELGFPLDPKLQRSPRIAVHYTPRLVSHNGQEEKRETSNRFPLSLKCPTLPTENSKNIPIPFFRNSFCIQASKTSMDDFQSTVCYYVYFTQ